MDDWQLLKDYATGNSEEAFRALVERYAGMVYHAALRQTGNAHEAEEAAQVVFIALAQKAGGIPRQATLYGWLFRATRFAVLNQARKNANRERREQEAIAMQPMMETNDADALWERITPLLNDALDKLSAADRELVMIRFFGNRSHKDVADALGVTEETARKRISRAIERLRASFAKRGVVVPSLALAAAFAAHGAKAAPIEVAATWAKVAIAKAAAGTAATSGGGIFTLVTSAKGTSLMAATAGLVILGAAGFTLIKSVSGGSPVAAPLATNAATALVAGDTNDSLAGPVTLSKPATNTGANTALTAALDKVRAALHDTNETTVYPNAVMRDAIAGLGDGKKTAVPILEAALSDADAQVRLRAVDGLGIIGPEARESAPQLLGLLRDGGFYQTIPQTQYITTGTGPGGRERAWDIYTDNMLLYALGQIRPATETLSALAEMMKQNQFVRHVVVQAISQFRSDRRTLEGGGWLWHMAGEDAKVLNDTFRPLLQDPDSMVRYASALTLVSALGNQSDPGVFPVAAELMTSGDDTFMRGYGLSILDKAARDESSDVAKPGVLNAARLGPYLNDAVSALIDVAYHSTREDLRLKASKMLEVLSPELTKSNAGLAAVLEQQKQMEAFTSKATSGETTTPEILEGLKRFPKAAPDIANYFARNGSNAVELLPAFQEALAALTPSPEASQMDRRLAIRARQRLADAMQKIAPGLPKPIFTGMDALGIGRIMQDPALQADAERFQKVSAARKLAGWPDRKSVGSFDVSPEEMRHLLAAMKDADAATYDALAAKVKEIDPHFFDAPAGHGKEN